MGFTRQRSFCNNGQRECGPNCALRRYCSRAIFGRTRRSWGDRWQNGLLASLVTQPLKGQAQPRVVWLQLYREVWQNEPKLVGLFSYATHQQKPRGDAVTGFDLDARSRSETAGPFDPRPPAALIPDLIMMVPIFVDRAAQRQRAALIHHITCSGEVAKCLRADVNTGVEARLQRAGDRGALQHHARGALCRIQLRRALTCAPNGRVLSPQRAPANVLSVSANACAGSCISPPSLARLHGLPVHCGR